MSQSDPKRLFLGWSLAALFLAPAIGLAGAPRWWPDQKIEALPEISFDATTRNLGKVDEGIEVNTQFLVSNKGSAPLDIQDVKSSCGCTFPVWKTRRLMPGQSAVLPVTVDTAMKQDKVEKTMDVISNDPNRSFVTLTLKLDVLDPHKDLGPEATAPGGGGQKNKKPKIFSADRCMMCHVDQGLGLKGKELFEADCAMCHRVGAHGKASVGPLLEKQDNSSPAVQAMMREVVSRGSKTNRSMPGFLSSAGGPLDAAQIESLIDYLKKTGGQGR